MKNMKLSLLACLPLLVIGNCVAGVAAETINQSTVTQSNCGWVKDCASAIDKKGIVESVTPLKGADLTSSGNVENTIQLSEEISEEKISTVASLAVTPQGSASDLKSSNNLLLSQITPPTDSRGNLLFRSTRSGPSYIGVGANFGITGESNIGDRSLAIISKLGLSETVSVRPSVFLFNDFASILIPVTYDFAPQQVFDGFAVSPYLGAGAALSTGTNTSIGLLVSAGVDFPISSIFTVNIGANLAFLRTTDLGILIGLGYNF